MYMHSACHRPSSWCCGTPQCSKSNSWCASHQLSTKCGVWRKRVVSAQDIHHSPLAMRAASLAIGCLAALPFLDPRCFQHPASQQHDPNGDTHAASAQDGGRRKQEAVVISVMSPRAARIGERAGPLPLQGCSSVAFSPPATLGSDMGGGFGSGDPGRRSNVPFHRSLLSMHMAGWFDMSVPACYEHYRLSVLPVTCGSRSGGQLTSDVVCVVATRRPYQAPQSDPSTVQPAQAGRWRRRSWR